MIYVLLFIAGFLEEFVAIFYYKLVQKHYKMLCAIVSMVRTFLWAFVLTGILKNFSDVYWMVVAYALGGGLGDYVSLSIEPFVEKWILKIPRRGRKKKWWFFLVERRK